jgi:peptide/nickel transport system permease protein
LFAVVNLDFWLPRVAPGNPAEVFIGGSGRLNPNAVALLMARFGLNHPLIVQYELYLKNLFLTWPPFFGFSFEFYPTPVTQLFATRIATTMILILSSVFLGFIMSYFVARFSAVRRGKKGEVGALYGALTLHSIPIYWTAMVLLWVFAIALRWFPAFGNVNPSASGLMYWGSLLYHSVLPIAVLTLSVFGQLYLTMRSSIQQVLQSDYVIAAKNRGLRERLVASRYILRNSMLPIISLLTFSMAGLLSRAVLVEAVFGYAGVGDLLVDAVDSLDYPVIEATLFYFTIIVIISGLIGDILVRRLDPRITK